MIQWPARRKAIMYHDSHSVSQAVTVKAIYKRSGSICETIAVHTHSASPARVRPYSFSIALN